MSKNNRRLQHSFFSHDDVVGISRSLLGKVLCTQFDDGYTEGVIVETEAYRAPEDQASHAYKMRRTPRTEIMFGEAGVAYIYLCYGIHHLFNIVTGPRETPHAVLIRAVEPKSGLEIMQARRNLRVANRRLTGGPGSASKAMGLHKEFNGMNLVDEPSSIWIEDCGDIIPPSQIIESPRVGVDYAGESAKLPWRFRIRGNKWTSPAK